MVVLRYPPRRRFTTRRTEFIPFIWRPERNDGMNSVLRIENWKSAELMTNCKENDVMAQPPPDQKIALTIHLSPEVAKRLKAAAEAQKRSAADLVADLLDRHLPRLPTGPQSKGSIPYT
jgi:hypothetical protein